MLASGSATRLALLRAAGLAVQACPVALDEAVLKAQGRRERLDAASVALRLATAKAMRANAPGALVIGADQMLVCDGVWHDKPEDGAAARAQLLALRGRAHLLPTAVTCVRDGEVLWQHVATPRLVIRRFSDAFLADYLAREGEALLGCVGGYRLEGMGVQLFEDVEGEFAAILGLPLLALLGFLRSAGAIAA